MGFEKEVANLLALNGNIEHVKGPNLLCDVSNPGRGLMWSRPFSVQLNQRLHTSFFPHCASNLTHPSGLRVLLGTGGSEKKLLAGGHTGRAGTWSPGLTVAFASHRGEAAASNSCPEECPWRVVQLSECVGHSLHVGFWLTAMPLW